MKTIIKNPLENPKITEIENSLESLQKCVAGNIECVYDLNKYNISIWCNDEGKLEQLPLNFWIYDKQDILAGAAVFTGTDDDGETIGLSDEQLKIVFEYLEKNELTQFDILKLALGM